MSALRYVTVTSGNACLQLSLDPNAFYVDVEVKISNCLPGLVQLKDFQTNMGEEYDPNIKYVTTYQFFAPTGGSVFTKRYHLCYREHDVNLILQDENNTVSQANATAPI